MQGRYPFPTEIFFQIFEHVVPPPQANGHRAKANIYSLARVSSFFHAHFVPLLYNSLVFDGYDQGDSLECIPLLLAHSHLASHVKSLTLSNWPEYFTGPEPPLLRPRIYNFIRDLIPLCGNLQTFAVYDTDFPHDIQRALFAKASSLKTLRTKGVAGDITRDCRIPVTFSLANLTIIYGATGWPRITGIGPLLSNTSTLANIVLSERMKTNEALDFFIQHGPPKRLRSIQVALGHESAGKLKWLWTQCLDLQTIGLVTSDFGNPANVLLADVGPSSSDLPRLQRFIGPSSFVSGFCDGRPVEDLILDSDFAHDLPPERYRAQPQLTQPPLEQLILPRRLKRLQVSLMKLALEGTLSFISAACPELVSLHLMWGRSSGPPSLASLESVAESKQVNLPHLEHLHVSCGNEFTEGALLPAQHDALQSWRTCCPELNHVIFGDIVGWKWRPLDGSTQWGWTPYLLAPGDLGVMQRLGKDPLARSWGHPYLPVEDWGGFFAALVYPELRTFTRAAERYEEFSYD